MALDDFFTLTEMKDGLATLARVEELLSMMQKQKDCHVNNVGDPGRQWSTVASILAATESKDCLNHFVEMDGLSFLNHWLQEAKKWSNDASDTSVENLINELLGVLEKILVAPEKSSVCGIENTFKELLHHRSINVRERVRTMLDKWIQVKDNGSNCQNPEKRETCCDDDAKPSAVMSIAEGLMATDSVIDASPSKEGTSKGSGTKSAVGGSPHSNDRRCSDGSGSDAIKDGKDSICSQCMPAANSDSADAKIATKDMNSLSSSLVSNPSQEGVSIAEESVCPAVGVASSTDTCSSLVVASRRNIDDQHNVTNKNYISDGSKEMEPGVSTEKLSLCKSGKEGTVIASKPSGLTASPVHMQESVTENVVTCEFDVKKSQICMANTSEAQQKGGIFDCGIPKYINKEIKLVAHSENSFQGASSKGHISRKHTGFESSPCRTDVLGTDSKHGDNDLNMKERKRADLMMSSASLNPAGHTKVNGMEGRRSEMELEYGEIDALEVARQVAAEVEREVVDYREPCCSSSSGGNSEGEIMDSSSPDIVEKVHEELVIKQLNENESPTRKYLSDDSSSKENSSKFLGNIEFGVKNAGDELDSHKLASFHESVGKTEKSRCNFDLNEDVCTEEADYPMVLCNQVGNLSAPIPIFAIEGAAGFPVTPLHFEGESGWRGSAATSAFRPAPPRRTPDCEKTVSGLKHKAKFLGIDLNVAEHEDNAAVDPLSVKLISVSSGLPSGDSLIEVSSRGAERLEFDLNRLGDEDTLPNPSSYWRLRYQNGHYSPSPVSSSSSRQHSMRDIDLNDNPSLLHACGSNSRSKSTSRDMITNGSLKVDDSVIPIMGSRMSVERKDVVNQTHPSFLGNGLTVDFAMATRPSVWVPHMAPPGYGYNGIAMGTPIPLPQSFYSPGPISYMAGSGGATAIPHMFGPSAGINGIPSYGSPFLTSVAGATSGFNVAGLSRPSLDLNSGSAPMESGSGEVGNLKQLFMQGNGTMGGQIKSSSQPTVGSGLTLKRKEPDSGWETCTYGYNHVESWQ